ncbi:MAG: hypothetical protein DI640_13040 [Sphingomonas taxi]|uniref:Phage protein n=1 Tax=Sphingomonas taxi TaxID=1549858 RepID=A0A2W4YR86_9SPHN|nr:MAG: hypothetical protein DI640_13040 [Sphingomonas taxi]
MISDNLMNAARDVMGERQRQIAREGWSEAHDDEYREGQLAAAAACYCHPEPAMDDTRGVPFSWPWQTKWWKPTDRRRDLVKAGALILAEIERLDRIEQTRATGEDA